MKRLSRAGIAVVLLAGVLWAGGVAEAGRLPSSVWVCVDASSGVVSRVTPFKSKCVGATQDWSVSYPAPLLCWNPSLLAGLGKTRVVSIAPSSGCAKQLRSVPANTLSLVCANGETGVLRVPLTGQCAVGNKQTWVLPTSRRNVATTTTLISSTASTTSTTSTTTSSTTVSTTSEPVVTTSSTSVIAPTSTESKVESLRPTEARLDVLPALEVPAAPPIVLPTRGSAVTVFKTRVSARVFFGLRSSFLTPQAKRTLSFAVSKIPKNCTLEIEINGADQNSANTSNIVPLSTRRAQSVQSYLRTLRIQGKFMIRIMGVVGDTSKARRADATIIYS